MLRINSVSQTLSKCCELEQTVEHLERIRQRQASKMADLIAEAQVFGSESRETKLRSEEMVRNLSEDLRLTKHALEQVRNSEREVR
ncbi:unnamed protein product [Protopolystoma xenopodis]|uniref:Uncharacterized protein n=1 Tax=Protopolystoma xenopodis TaxID=117903 RepID=A0A448WCQ2_9PLAT|nr:unnamed protein product [Protopolystoma xenopodis]